MRHWHLLNTARAYADLLTNLLVYDYVHERTGDGDTLVGSDEILES